MKANILFIPFGSTEETSPEHDYITNSNFDKWMF